MSDRLICKICNEKDTIQIYENYPGYVENTFFDIWECKSCNTQFINTEQIDDNLYDIIYSSGEIFGYDRYFRYSNEIKKQKNPLKYLAGEEAPYYAVYISLKRKRELEILEVGCGHGYLTYSLIKNGHKVIGVDISQEAINSAISNFGNIFYCSDIKSFIKNTGRKFDCIVATEVIEHTKDPTEFINTCMEGLKNDGFLLLTTPSKDAFNGEMIWATDLPPVHTYWLSRKSIQKIAIKNNYRYNYISFTKYYPKAINKFIQNSWYKRRKVKSILKSNGMSNLTTVSSNKLKKISSYFLHKFYPIRKISNFLFNKFVNREYIMGVKLTKINNK